MKSSLIFSCRHIENKHPEKIKKCKGKGKKPNPFDSSDESSPVKAVDRYRTRSAALRSGAADDSDSEEEVSELDGLPKSFTDENYLNLTAFETEFKVICLNLLSLT